MMMKRMDKLWGMHKRAAALMALILLVACGDQSGTPSPLPIPDLNFIRSSAAPLEMEVAVVLVGMQQAVAGSGQITVENGERLVTTSSTDKGSFYASIQAKAKDTLKLKYNASAPAELVVTEMSITTPFPPGPIDGVTPVTKIDEQRVLIQGQLSQSNETMRSALVVNVKSGEVVSGSADTKHQFSIEIKASTGDEILVYENEEILTGSWRLKVP
jgi:hypothetical protein